MSKGVYVLSLEGGNFYGFAEVIAPKRIEYWSDPGNWSELKQHNALPDAEKERGIGTTLKDFVEDPS